MPGYHERFVEPNHYGGAVWLPLLFAGMSLMWLVAPIIIATMCLWWRQRRFQAAPQPLVQPLIEDDPSAFELLRRRYVVGEIDVADFEEMTERLLVSEHMERRQQPLLARYEGYDRYLRRERLENDPQTVTL